MIDLGCDIHAKNKVQYLNYLGGAYKLSRVFKLKSKNFNIFMYQWIEISYFFKAKTFSFH